MAVQNGRIISLQDWFLLNLFEGWCESNLIQRNQADKEDKRLL